MEPLHSISDIFISYSHEKAMSPKKRRQSGALAPGHDTMSHGLGIGHHGFGCTLVIGGLVQTGFSTVHVAVMRVM